MKLLNCILFATVALGANLAHGTVTPAACAANPGGTVAVNRQVDLQIFQDGKSVAQPVDISTSTSAAR